MKKISYLLLFCLAALSTQAQDNVKLQIKLLTPDLIAEVTLDKEPFYAWMKEVMATLTEELQTEKGELELMVILTLHKEEEPTITIYGRPVFSAEMAKSLYDSLLALKAPNTKITDYSLALHAIVNGDGAEVEFPEIESPEVTELAEYNKLDLAGKKAALQDWIIKDVIPVIAQYEVSVDPSFQGVLKVGELLASEKYLNSNVEKITSQNPDYWRATVEMSPGNQIIPFSKVCMQIANGEFDRAKNLMFFLNLFAEEGSLSDLYHYPIKSRLDSFYEDLNTVAQQGIKLHDEGKYEKAVEHYEALLKIFPKSAWINYEHYYSNTADWKDFEKTNKEWRRVKKIIYSYDPMYHMDVRANTGKGGYHIFRRMESTELFRNNENLRTDIVKYADIAFDLENYSIAAQLYWLIITHLSAETYDDRNIIAHFIYCLDKLGDKEIIKNFDQNFPKEFAKIEKERRRLMEENAMYKSFEKKE